MYIKIKESHHVLMNTHKLFLKMEITVNFGKKQNLNHWEILVLKISIFSPEYMYTHTQKNPLGLGYKLE